MAELNATRLTVYRSNGNIYAQIIEGNSNKVLATASTVEAEMKKKLKNTSDVAAASEVGKRIAEKAIFNSSRIATMSSVGITAAPVVHLVRLARLYLSRFGCASID